MSWTNESSPRRSARSGGNGTRFRIYTPASLGDAIRHYRREAGLTQAELAEMAGLQRSYLSELETGKETEQLKRVLRLLRQLGVHVAEDETEIAATALANELPLYAQLLLRVFFHRVAIWKWIFSLS